MQPRASVDFTPTQFSPRAAREHTRTLLGPWLTDEEIEDVALLVTELVTNAVRHAGSRIRLSIELDEHCLRVEVFDESLEEPIVRVPSPDELGGRGLLLVDAIATNWGCQFGDDGKIVWFELARDTSQVTALER